MKWCGRALRRMTIQWRRKLLWKKASNGETFWAGSSKGIWRKFMLPGRRRFTLKAEKRYLAEQHVPEGKRLILGKESMIVPSAK